VTPVYSATKSELAYRRTEQGRNGVVYSLDGAQQYVIEDNEVLCATTKEPVYRRDGEWWYDLAGQPAFFENNGYVASGIQETWAEMDREKAMKPPPTPQPPAPQPPKRKAKRRGWQALLRWATRSIRS
jgi:hypothetical protein